jgi:hypothetical protein
MLKIEPSSPADLSVIELFIAGLYDPDGSLILAYHLGSNLLRAHRRSPARPREPRTELPRLVLLAQKEGTRLF